ncbi:hypothetical protein EZS27_024556 [termite gut metagenome]|uniref:Uncharacterized protein n=1 Tax=termite gut metagenome TaxID=433724 RepID=A0A5J4QYF3_9ZZZZ
MKETKIAVTNTPQNHVYKMLDFLSLSVKGLNMVILPPEHSRSCNIEWYLKKEFLFYCDVKDSKQETFDDFCKTIKFDMDIWRDYNGITGNHTSKGIVFDATGNIDYSDGINHLKIHQTEKYGDDDFPYLQLLQHDNFVQLLSDHTVYENLKEVALTEIKDGHEYELNIIEDKIGEIENDLPQHFTNDNYRKWYLETRLSLNEIKFCVHKELFDKDRDIKSFVYLMYVIFSSAGFSIDKGKSFSKYLALFLFESEATIDRYLKQANEQYPDTKKHLSTKKCVPLWNSPDRKIQKLIAVLKQIKTFHPAADILQKVFKKICQNLPKEERLNFLTDEEKVLYIELKSCCE